MIISKALEYVYISIPRTASKSMSNWLVDHYQGEWHGRHHEWRVPEECRNYLVFTLVRNPYEIQASGWYFQPVIKSDEQPARPQTYADAVRNWVRPPDEPVTQKEFIEWSGISQVLYFEHLPECLKQLPFVDPGNVPSFPHLNAGGFRPSGGFFDIMAREDEEIVWNSSREDFELLGYERFDCGPPKAPNQSLLGTREHAPAADLRSREDRA